MYKWPKYVFYNTDQIHYTVSIYIYIYIYIKLYLIEQVAQNVFFL